MTGSYLAWQRYNPFALTFSDIPKFSQSGNKSLNNYPEKLTIADLKISLPIMPVDLTNGKWPTTDRGVSYVKQSALPGSFGNAIIYGHNFRNILGNLTKIKPGMNIIIRGSMGEIYKYKVIYTITVNPSDTKILDTSTDKMLTVYTCTGWFDLKRFVAVGILDQ
jgi:LPXTG-site transpeptidase (sortase) family protein